MARRLDTARIRLILFLIFSTELLALMYAQLADWMSFDRFAFCDHGANLTLQYLVNVVGYRPTIDFGYNYGLLPILFGRMWFAIAGNDATGYQSAMIVCDLVAAWGIASILAQLRLGIVALALSAIALGYAVQPSYPSLAHALEAVLLILGLSRQARGANAAALAYSAAAIFAKPAMGYFYSLLLVVAIVYRLIRTRATLRQWITAFAPAASVGLVLTAVLGASYGFRPLIDTILPWQGAANYRAAHFGFFHGEGRAFWDTPGVPWWGHLLDVSGFWIVSSTLLLAFAGWDWFRIRRDSDPTLLDRRRTEVIVSCALLNLCFVAFLFGNRGSWIYYSFLVVIGIALAIDATRIRRDVGVVLALVALVSWTDVVIATHRRNLTMHESPETEGLWATAKEQAEWASVLALTERSKVRILDLKGGVELMFPQFGPPVTLYLDPGLIRPGEIALKVSQLSQTQMVVVPTNIANCSDIPQAPEIVAAMKSFDRRWKGDFFEVFARRPTK